MSDETEDAPKARKPNSDDVTGEQATDLPPVTDLDEFTEYLCMLAYSDPFVGKTCLAGSGGEKMLIIATEEGTFTARRMGSKAKTVRVRSYKQIGAVVNQLRRTGAYQGFAPEWVAVDTLGGMQELIRTGVLLDPPNKKPRNIDQPELQDYGVMMSRYQRLIKAFKDDVPCHVLFLAHAQHIEDEDGNPLIMPDIQGKWGTNDKSTAARWTMSKVHAYGALRVVKPSKAEDSVRRWQFASAGPYRGKDRYGVLSPYVDNPNLKEIAARIIASNTTTKEG
jgi:hypothetical protein